MDKASGELLREVNNVIDSLVDLREAIAGLDKMITDELYPLPVETLENPPKKVRKARKKHETDLQILVSEKIPEGIVPSEVSVDTLTLVPRECCGLHHVCQ